MKTPPVPNGKILVGDGTWFFSARVDGDDLVVRATVATWFGGDSDPQDNGYTASGVVTKGNPEVLGCALPLRRRHGPTAGSPLPAGIPWHTLVRVYNRGTGQQITIPVIDLGPAKHTGHALDLTLAAFKAIGGDLGEGTMIVDYRIMGGAHYIQL